MTRFKRIIHYIAKIGKSTSYKGFEKLKQAFIHKWSEKEPREHYYQLGKLVAISIVIILVYTSFFSMEKGADDSSVLVDEPKIPNMLRIVETGELRNLDSALVNDQSTQNVLHNIMEGLMRLDKDSKPTYGMAEKVEVSPDYKTYMFTLRKNAKWSDGQPVTAEDFIFAWTRAVDSKISKNSYLFQNIKGFTEGKIEQGMMASNGNKLTITLSKPDRNFLSLTTNSAMFPQRKDLYEKYQDVFGSDIRTLVSNGPFQLETFTLNKLVAVKNSSYWDHQSVKSNGFIIFVSKNNRDSDNKYVSNEVDFMQMHNKMDEATIKSDMITVPRTTIYYLYVNPKLDGNTKKYYAYAVEKLMDQTSFVKSKSIMPDLTYQRNDLAKTDEKENIISPTKPSEVTCIDQPEVKKVCEVFKEKMCQACTTNEVQAKEIREQMKGRGLDLVVNLWKSYYYDPLTFLDIFTTGAVENTTGYTNPTYDQLVAQAHKEIDAVKQARFIAEAEYILTYQDKSVIPLYQRVIPRLQKPYVQGIVYHPYGPEYSLKWMQIKQHPK
ncbi:peptide ABC transporter substrate-binding protein [Thermoactinomyces sp. DSM 45892]|uniref:peptide ABC transporter substrate-binding protein n=1 Tax=Thermoactinomyces sp. DSM 45892 TaxID=1882753 RepID=UPI000896BA4F|nr:peptide ABC transporter substrate-binding protein [Thermoactinomyces sp. DSM 45892]SDZ36991.1 oligopeptide transport system substrate-binding protein/dipeptide transport system substrate-binding protein [Thermoactinomyces sp. DSM 45892]